MYRILILAYSKEIGICQNPVCFISTDVSNEPGLKTAPGTNWRQRDMYILKVWALYSVAFGWKRCDNPRIVNL